MDSSSTGTFIYIVWPTIFLLQVSYNSTMIFSSTLSNGTYYYEIILSSSIFRLTPSVGYFQINGHNTTLSLSYGNAPKVTYYNASFREKGLPSDYLFTVSIYQYAYYDQLATNSTVISSWVSVSFSLPNGTYYFQD
jgi:hypothetical protein